MRITAPRRRSIDTHVGHELKTATSASVAPSPTELGAEVICLGCKPNGVNIDKNYGALHPNRSPKRSRVTFGIALDGDAARVIFVDERGLSTRHPSASLETARTPLDPREGHAE